MPKGIRYNNLLSALVSIAGAATLNGIAPKWVKAIFIAPGSDCANPLD